jgi:hypothetical protein
MITHHRMIPAIHTQIQAVAAIRAKEEIIAPQDKRAISVSSSPRKQIGFRFPTKIIPRINGNVNVTFAEGNGRAPPGCRA